jgi:hypothetical protein
VAEVDEEIDVILIRRGAIEYGKPHHIADIEEKLFESAALPGHKRFFFCRPADL